MTPETKASGSTPGRGNLMSQGVLHFAITVCVRFRSWPRERLHRGDQFVDVMLSVRDLRIWGCDVEFWGLGDLVA